MKIEKLQLTPAYQALSVDLRQRIVAGEIQPGEPLPTEADLAQSYGVHRSTVREGLRHLEQDGLLKRVGKKLTVTVPSSDKLAYSRPNVHCACARSVTGMSGNWRWCWSRCVRSLCGAAHHRGRVGGAGAQLGANSARR